MKTEKRRAAYYSFCILFNFVFDGFLWCWKYGLSMLSPFVAAF